MSNPNISIVPTEVTKLTPQTNNQEITVYDKTIADIPKILIPKKAKEGDVLEIRVDIEETEKRKKEIENLMDDLFED